MKKANAFTSIKTRTHLNRDIHQMQLSLRMSSFFEKNKIM